jgi:hypothetical protein
LKSRAALLIFIFLVFNTLLFARGKKEEPEVKTQNDEWILCVTNFDVSSLPKDKWSVSDVISKQIVERLNAINYRTRVSREYALYEDYAWSNARSTAAKALSAKLDERSMQIYSGEAKWKYKKNLARIDAEIEKLRLAFEEIDSNAPLINNEPVVKLTAGNITSIFPEPPAEGSEYKFCRDQKADAFLTGYVTDFHGRYYLSIKLYTFYTRSFVYEDSIIFSPDDMDNALSEITSRLLLTLSGNKPAVVTIAAEPKETLVLINRSFAGKGEITEMEYPPGKYIVTASAADHEPLTEEIEFLPGEHINITFKLKPIEYGNVEISGANSGGSVYHGSLYAGEAPYTLRLPLGTMEYVELINNDEKDEKIGKIVFDTPDNDDSVRYLTLRIREPLPQGRVDKARRMFYWSWGATWIAGIATLISYYSYVDSYNAITYSGSNNQSFIENNTRLYYISMGAVIGLITAVVFDAFFISRYLYVSNRDSATVARTSRK